MNAPIPAPACYGVGCPRHSSCARYLQVDGMRGGPVVGTCAPGVIPVWPGYVAVREAVV